VSTVPAPSPVPGASTPRRRRRWVWPVATAAAFVVGIAAGGSGGDNPTTSPEFTEVVAERDALQDDVDGVAKAAVDAEVVIATREDELDARSADLDVRQADVEAREAAVTATEQAVAATQIEIGTWTVGRDIEPGHVSHGRGRHGLLLLGPLPQRHQQRRHPRERHRPGRPPHRDPQ